MIFEKVFQVRKCVDPRILLSRGFANLPATLHQVCVICIPLFSDAGGHAEVWVGWHYMHLEFVNLKFKMNEYEFDVCHQITNNEKFQIVVDV